jgi:Domain of unknown function (DUF5615)
MARFYSNENIPLQVVTERRNLGHDVLTSLDAGRANASVPNSEVLEFAVADGRMPSGYGLQPVRSSAARLSTLYWILTCFRSFSSSAQ